LDVLLNQSKINLNFASKMPMKSARFLSAFSSRVKSMKLTPKK